MNRAATPARDRRPRMPTATRARAHRPRATAQHTSLTLAVPRSRRRMSPRPRRRAPSITTPEWTPDDEAAVQGAPRLGYVGRKDRRITLSSSRPLHPASVVPEAFVVAVFHPTDGWRDLEIHRARTQKRGTRIVLELREILNPKASPVCACSRMDVAYTPSSASTCCLSPAPSAARRSRVDPAPTSRTCSPWRDKPWRP